MDSVNAAVWVGRQAPACVRQAQALVVQCVIELPAELEISALCPMEVLSEGEIGIPESRSAATGWPQSRRTKLPPGTAGVETEWRAIGTEARRDLFNDRRGGAKAGRQRARIQGLILKLRAPLDV